MIGYKRKITELTALQEDELLSGAIILEQDKHGIKVLQLQDKTLFKWFRNPKRFYSSAHIYPYALRFVNNAIKLTQKKIPTVYPTTIYFSLKNKKLGVQYIPVQGISLKEVLSKLSCNIKKKILFENFGMFISNLHDKGIYFRSLHFGNIIVKESIQFGLVDVTDTYFYNHVLKAQQRINNLKVITKYRKDYDQLREFMDEFLVGYLNNENGNSLKQKIKTIF